MDNLELLECCHVVLDFLDAKDEKLTNLGESKTYCEMNRVLSKNNLDMINFMRWLSHEYNFDSPDIYDDGRSYFSDGFKFPEAPAKTYLKYVISEIRNKKLEELGIN